MPELNRSSLAKELGISRSQISRILSGQVNPPVKVLRGLSVALNASLDEVDLMLKAARAAGHESKTL